MNFIIRFLILIVFTAIIYFFCSKSKHRHEGLIMAVFLAGAGLIFIV
ncbi:MAG: hypothetical protein IJ861_07715 [Clostridia bacterium]|nr:hypothetical protein [Clostridia bacterium]